MIVYSVQQPITRLAVVFMPVWVRDLEHCEYINNQQKPLPNFRKYGTINLICVFDRLR